MVHLQTKDGSYYYNETSDIVSNDIYTPNEKSAKNWKLITAEEASEILARQHTSATIIESDRPKIHANDDFDDCLM